MKITLVAVAVAAYMMCVVNAQVVVQCNDTLVDGANCMNDCGCGCTQPPETIELNCDGGSSCNNLMACLNYCYCVDA
jgi:hypothetical protein